MLRSSPDTEGGDLLHPLIRFPGIRDRFLQSASRTASCSRSWPFSFAAGFCFRAARLSLVDGLPASHPDPEGLYCPAGDFHIDPMRPVARALITHGHSDHARAGHGAVLATRETLEIMAIRYGEQFRRDAAGAPPMARSIEVGGVTRQLSSRRPCAGFGADRHRGHARRRARASSSRATTSAQRDPTCLPFEPVRCDIFITEATFGLPVFRHPDTRARSRAGSSLRSGCFPSARISSAPIRWARRSAWWRCCAKPGTTGRSICTARWKADRILHSAKGCRFGETREGRPPAIGASSPARSCLCPPSAHQGSLVAQISRACRRLRIRLDAHPRPGAPARRRTAAGRSPIMPTGTICTATILETGCRRSLGHAWRG